VKFPDLKRLRFDFSFNVKNITYLIEADGRQHQEFVPYFHRTVEGFEHSRQRDLIKNYFVNNSDNLKLIRLDHTMFSIHPDHRDKSIKNIKKFIKSAIKSNDKITANRDIYTWINDNLPHDNYIKEYILNDDLSNSEDSLLGSNSEDSLLESISEEYN